MELRELRAFAAVADRRSFTHAARDLGIAQPSVSKTIRLLEEELGTPLFHRMKGNLTLTPAAETLLPWARRLLAETDAATSEVRELAELRRGRLALGATPSLTRTLVPPALARFHAAYPGIELRLAEAGSGDLVRALEEGGLDLALVILPLRHPSLVTEPLLREELVVAVPLDHAFASRRRIKVSELRDVPLVMFREGYDLRTATLAACRRAGFAPTLAVEGGEMDGVLRLVAAGLGVAVVPSLVVDRGGPLRAVRLDGSLTRTVGIAHRRDRRLSRAAREFLATLRRLLAEPAAVASLPAGLEVLAAPERTGPDRA